MNDIGFGKMYFLFKFIISLNHMYSFKRQDKDFIRIKF